MTSSSSKIRKNNMRLKTSLIAISVMALSGCSKTEQTFVKQTDEPTSGSQNQASDKNSTDAPDYIKSLLWVHNADAEADLKHAIENNDYAFWVLASRIPVPPGVDQTKHAELLSKCGQKYLPGMGDVIFDEQHDELHNKAMKYAVAYNKQLIDYCKNK